MKDPRETEVAPAPLFDRLLDLDRWTPREPRPFRTLTREQLLASVQREVEHLLNTRCALTVEEAEALDPRERTVLDYGVPDLHWMSPTAPTDQARLGLLLARTLAAYEPRLRGARVEVETFHASQRTLGATVSAQLVLGRLAEPISFPVMIHAGGGWREEGER